MEKQLVKCSRIGVDCVINDPVDVRCGGSQYLGFNFNVLDEKVDSTKKYIEATLKSFGVPFIGFTTECIEVKEEQLWDEDRIFDCISEEADYLIGEAARKYKIAPSKRR